MAAIGAAELAADLKVKAGRPTREQANRRQAQLLDAALDHFLESGFERATVDAIALSVNMTKRTIYARYPAKSDLFLAAVSRAIDAMAMSVEDLEALDDGDLESTLVKVAMTRIATVMSPQGLRLQRIVNAESYRFPQIFDAMFEKGAGRIMEFLANLLERETRAGRLHVAAPEETASIFLGMTISGPVRFFVAGREMDMDELEQRIRNAVHIFLNGVR